MGLSIFLVINVYISLHWKWENVISDDKSQLLPFLSNVHSLAVLEQMCSHCCLKHDKLLFQIKIGIPLVIHEKVFQRKGEELTWWKKYLHIKKKNTKQMYVLAIYTGPLLVCLAFNRQYVLLFGYSHVEIT